MVPPARPRRALALLQRTPALPLGPPCQTPPACVLDAGRICDSHALRQRAAPDVRPARRLALLPGWAAPWLRLVLAVRQPRCEGVGPGSRAAQSLPVAADSVYSSVLRQWLPRLRHASRLASGTLCENSLHTVENVISN